MSFFKEIRTEKQARAIAWTTKFEGKPFVCPKCAHAKYWELKSEPEIRKCRKCGNHVRLRAGTMFESSKLPMLTWMRAIYFVMSSKRGISALELKNRLEIGSYRTSLFLLMKIRVALMERDSQYRLTNTIELDGTSFCSSPGRSGKQVLVAVETREWFDSRGRRKSKAGFAKVIVADETTKNVADFVEDNILPGAKVLTDSGQQIARADVEGVQFDHRRLSSPTEKFEQMPWVHRFVSNAKAWIVGTHHGVEQKNLHLYLAEFAYRFNRRHDPDSLFHRALAAMMRAKAL
ncbi:MAG: IS1595 family transposase [Bdellovibrionales bacterium]|nr:IS1595 family transposase [Bdellovibrionales bacterium]